jgi:hypothetical protein
MAEIIAAIFAREYLTGGSGRPYIQIERPAFVAELLQRETGEPTTGVNPSGRPEGRV